MAKGLVFKTAGTMFEESSKYAKYMKTFSSMQGEADYMPYFCIEYDTTISTTGITLSSTSLTLDVGNTYQLKATVKPDNATNKSLVWSSSNTSVATVDSTGKVTAKSSGTATISVKSSANTSLVKKCVVTVNSLIINNETSGVATFLIAEGTAIFPFTFPTYLNTEITIDSIIGNKKRIANCYAIGYYTNTTAEINPSIMIAEHKINNTSIKMGTLQHDIIIPSSWVFDAKESYPNIWIDGTGTCYTSVQQRINSAINPICIISDTFNI